MLFAAEVPAVPEGFDLNALMPPWAQQLSLLTLLIVIVLAFARGWVVTRAQADREIEAERRITEVWKTNAESSNELTKQLTEGFEPVLDSNAAILKAVEALQDRQERAEERENQARWLREQRGNQG